MTRTVRKMLLGDLWRIGEYESWFSDMAGEGYHLRKIGYLFAHFEKGDSENIRYRIDTSWNKNISEEQKELYTKGGWDYVTKFREFNVFASPTSLNAPELHTDSAEQSYTLKSFDKKIARNTLYVILLSMLAIGMTSFIWLTDKTPTLSFIDGSSTQFVVIVLVYLFLTYSMIRATLSIRKLRKALSEGSPINHQAPWKKHYKKNLFFSIIIITLSALSATVPYVQLIKHKTKALPQENIDLPVVRLADIEQDPKLVLNQEVVKNPFTGKNFGWESEITYDWSPLAPQQFETIESGIVSDKMWKDKSGTYSPSIHSQVYLLTFPWMGKSLIANLIARNDFIFDGEIPIRLESAIFDTLFIRESEESKEVVVAKGKSVIHVSYHGYADLDAIIKNAEKKIVLTGP